MAETKTPNPEFRAKVIEWAERQVAQHPTVKDEHGGTTEVPNTVDAVLQAWLGDRFSADLQDYKANELRQWMYEIAMEGASKGYLEMTRDELLQEVQDAYDEELSWDEDETIDSWCKMYLDGDDATEDVLADDEE